MKPPLIPQCEVCGRVRIGQTWVKDDQVKPDLTVWACPSCGANQHRAAIRAEKKWKRELRKDARTPHPVREMTAEDWERFK